MVKTFLVVLLVLFSFSLNIKNSWAIEVPILQLPNQGTTTTDTSPTLSWIWSGTCPQTGSCYRVQVDDSTGFSDPNKDYYTSNTSYSPQLSDNTWYWRVKAKEGILWSDWSEIWSLVISQTGAVSYPTPQTPQTLPTQESSPGNQGGKIELSEFMPNPKEGSEWVEVFNPGSTTVDISGYKIDDIEGGSSPFTIPQGTMIGGGNYLFFSFSARLNNEGDTVRFLNPDGQVIEEYSYKETAKGGSLAKDSSGTWQKTDTPTPGSKNIITTPVVAKEEKKSEKESKEVKEIAKSNEKTGKTGKTTKQRLEEESILGSQATAPSLSSPATQEPESSPQAATYGLVKNRWFFIPIILAGFLIIAAGVRLWLKKG